MDLFAYQKALTCFCILQIFQVKYLWLLFDLAVDSDNLVDNGPYRYKYLDHINLLWSSQSLQHFTNLVNLLNLRYIFSTEGHLLPLTPQISLAREHCSYLGGYCSSNSTKPEQEVLEEESNNNDRSNIYPYHESFPITGLIKVSIKNRLYLSLFRNSYQQLQQSQRL